MQCAHTTESEERLASGCISSKGILSKKRSTWKIVLIQVR